MRESVCVECSRKKKRGLAKKGKVESTKRYRARQGERCGTESSHSIMVPADRVHPRVMLLLSCQCIPECCSYSILVPAQVILPAQKNSLQQRLPHSLSRNSPKTERHRFHWSTLTSCDIQRELEYTSNNNSNDDGLLLDVFASKLSLSTLVDNT